MKQVFHNLQTKEVEVREVAEPTLRPGGVLVRNHASLISTGTERTSVATGQKSLVGMARSRPDLVRKVIDFAKRQGIMAAFNLVRDRLADWQALGYSGAGEIVDPGDCLDEFSRGDRVACAGVGYASHAEMIFVPRNLCVRIPEGVEYEEASFTTLTAIALQGVRQAEVSIGDVVLVTGLGLVGLLTVQLLKAAGAVVIGVDLQKARLEQARQFGADGVALAADQALPDLVVSMTQGRGVDIALITASTSSSAPTVQAAGLLRDRGRLVAVGRVGMDLPFSPFYDKELEVRYSRSYGPGRYDADYEEKGRDYPVGYVRWTERRNMEAALSLMAAGRLDLSRLISHRMPIEEAKEAYDLILESGTGEALAIVLTYPEKETSSVSSSFAPLPALPQKKCVIGWIGAGKFAQQALLPHFESMDEIELRLAASASGLSAARISERYGFTLPAAGIDEIMADESINTVVITTRHDSHASLVLRALEAGKENIYVEKPLAIKREDIEKIAEALEEHPTRLMIGFNRRFAPATLRLKEELAARQFPAILSYRVNAGYFEPDNWYQDLERGGGRLLGEGCHFTDLLSYLVDAPLKSVAAANLSDPGGHYLPDDNFMATLTFADGSIAHLTYLANGPRAISKERIEVFAGGTCWILDDFVRLQRIDDKKRTLWKGNQDKGHEAEVEAFVRSVLAGDPSPIAPEALIASSRVPFMVREAFQRGETVWL